MITSSDSFTTIDLGNYYAILPCVGHVRKCYDRSNINVTAVPQGFSYDSGSNPEFLSTEELRALIRKHVDPSFVAI